MHTKLHAWERIRIVRRDRLYVEPKPDAVRNISHLGRLRYASAQAVLDKHTHKGTMEICYLDGGEQTFFVNDTAYHLKGGEIFITYPDEVHGTGPLPMEKSTLYWIGVNLKSPKTRFLNYSESEAEELRARLLRIRPRMFRGGPVIRSLFEKAIGEYFTDDALGRIRFRNAVTDILVEVCSQARRGRSPVISVPIREVMHYVEQHLAETPSMQDLAMRAGLSTPRFKGRFRTEVGMAPNEYVQRAKIARAMTLLRSGGHTVTGTALDLGFKSGQYFATVFRKYTGKTPGALIRS
jgi:AraC-like DNA-binding protein